MFVDFVTNRLNMTLIMLMVSVVLGLIPLFHGVFNKKLNVGTMAYVITVASSCLMSAFDPLFSMVMTPLLAAMATRTIVEFPIKEEKFEE